MESGLTTKGVGKPRPATWMDQYINFGLEEVRSGDNEMLSPPQSPSSIPYDNSTLLQTDLDKNCIPSTVSSAPDETSSLIELISSTSSTTPVRSPRRRKLPAKCGGCRNTMRRYRTKLPCEHYVHVSCLRKMTKNSQEPVCYLCSERVKQIQLQEMPATIHIESKPEMPYSDAEKFLGKEILSENGDVEPLQLRSFVVSTGPNRCELMIRVRVEEKNNNIVHQKPTTDDEQQQKDALSKRAFNLIGSGESFEEHKNACGQLRLASEFYNIYLGKPVHVLLFEQCITIVTKENDGEPEGRIFDLGDSSIEVYRGSPDVLVIQHGDSPAVELEADNNTVTAWISAVNTSNTGILFHTCLHDGLTRLYETPHKMSGRVEVVLCVSFQYLKEALNSALGALHSQDRLGLVVRFLDGTVRWIAPHKPIWKPWEKILKLQIDLDHFQFATQSLLDTANSILSPARIGLQQSIIITSGLPIASTQICRASPEPGMSPLKLYAIGTLSDFDLGTLTLLHSTDSRASAQFLHAKTIHELGLCIGGIVEADRYSRHHSVQIKVSPQSGVKVRKFVGLPEELVTFHIDGTAVAELGNITTGRLKSVLVELEHDGKTTELRKLTTCEVSSYSAATGVYFQNTCLSSMHYTSLVAPQMLFDRFAFRAAEKLADTTLIPNGHLTEAINQFIQDALTSVDIARYFRYRNPPQIGGESYLLTDLCDKLLSDEAMVCRTCHFAWSLGGLQNRLYRAPSYDYNAIRIEALHVLQNQKSVTTRSGIEQIYKSNVLPTNQ